MAAPKGNQFWKLAKNPGSKPLFKSVDEFIQLANEYFKKNDGGKISWIGLCLAVGASSRQTLESYKKGDHGKEFIDPIKNALLVVENYYEEKLDGAKAIFVLKNFNWKDSQQIEHSVDKETISHAEKLAQARQRKQKDVVG